MHLRRYRCELTHWKTLNTFHSKTFCSGFAKQQLSTPRSILNIRWKKSDECWECRSRSSDLLQQNFSATSQACYKILHLPKPPGIVGEPCRLQTEKDAPPLLILGLQKRSRRWWYFLLGKTLRRGNQHFQGELPKLILTILMWLYQSLIKPRNISWSFWLLSSAVHTGVCNKSGGQLQAWVATRIPNETNWWTSRQPAGNMTTGRPGKDLSGSKDFY